MKKERLATYTMEVPLRFTFVAGNNLTISEFYAMAEKELLKRLDNGYFDIVEEEMSVVKRIVHYTREELEEEERVWKELKKGLEKNGI